MNILDRIVAATRIRIQRDKDRIPMDMLKEQCDSLPPLAFKSAKLHKTNIGDMEYSNGMISVGNQNSFFQAVAAPGMSFICEVKKASPSKGLISENFPYLHIAKAYEIGGAACISVLTEPDYFLGSDSYLEEITKTVSLPVLRKDFIVDPYQIYQSRLLGADAVLLIRSVLEPENIASFADITERLGMTALTEVHDSDELASVLELGLKLIGVNNRDLKTFNVDLENSIRLRALAPPDVVMVAESGIRCREDIILLEDAGIDAVLVGETLMRSSDVAEALLTLKS